MDTLSKRGRSEVMRRIIRENTKPELRVRSVLHRMGLRFRLHGKDIPGRPDIVFRQQRKVIFVHGCFWHQHRRCKLARKPKSNLEYWLPKLAGNCQRDTRVRAKLGRSGWSYRTIWECQTKDEARLRELLAAYLD